MGANLDMEGSPEETAFSSNKKSDEKTSLSSFRSGHLMLLRTLSQGKMLAYSAGAAVPLSFEGPCGYTPQRRIR